ncbi:hypothetical protein AMECASPLE_021510 [Ameca splendens]|uniref:Uncharacterized protein n=1 Tax=Ameca splendens TaxID=208324 RepID=A0ABV1A070_9TELE
MESGPTDSGTRSRYGVRSYRLWYQEQVWSQVLHTLVPGAGIDPPSWSRVLQTLVPEAGIDPPSWIQVLQTLVPEAGMESGPTDSGTRSRYGVMSYRLWYQKQV